MAIITYPLNNIEYTAEDAELYNSTRTSGVYSNKDHFEISVTDSRQVTIGTGIAWIQNSKFSGKVVGVKNEEILNIPLSHANLPRIDTIVLAFNSSLNASVFYVKQGEPSSSPIRPTLTKSETLYELGLYDINIPAGSATVLQENIVDTRADDERCGIMGSGIDDLEISSLPKVTEEDNGKILEVQDGEWKPAPNSALQKTGGTMTGALVAQNNTDYATKQVRNIFLVAEGEDLPSGANGDICLVYKP